MTTEFDKVFTELEAPDYPATCDQCGAEGTNVSMEEHECLIEEEAQLALGAIPLQALPSEQCADDCHFGDHDESPASRAGERDEWRILETITRTSVVNERGENVAVGMGRGARQRREHAEQIITEHNQHATLIEQRERLLRLLRPVTSPTACYCAVMKSEKCWHCEARELIAAIEQEREVESSTNGKAGK